MFSKDRNSQSGSEEPTKGSAADAANPERRELVEPDRAGARNMSSTERDARSRIHTDRDPEDDIHLASSDPREIDQETPDDKS